MSKTETLKREVRNSSSSKKNATIDEHSIRQRAFEIYLRRNGLGGNAMEDWLNAERELRNHKGNLRNS